ncbi:hypothetical protein TI04_02980 [Achromatium sp. WMS2]|nr:hypothetical protein TI04_02980 [Achromatium sp. WMS2]
MTASLHDTDFYSWTQQQAALLRSCHMMALDVTNLIDEIEDLGSSQRRALESRLLILLVHLLKWQYQPQLQGKNWSLTIKEQRRAINQLLSRNPGLQPNCTLITLDAYELAIFRAARETGLDEAIFPQTCPWTFDQIMDPEFWPE